MWYILVYKLIENDHDIFDNCPRPQKNVDKKREWSIMKEITIVPFTYPQPGTGKIITYVS